MSTEALAQCLNGIPDSSFNANDYRQEQDHGDQTRANQALDCDEILNMVRDQLGNLILNQVGYEINQEHEEVYTVMDNLSLCLKPYVSSFPSSLSCTNDQGQLPIHLAVWNPDAIKYVPMMAEVGAQLEANIGDMEHNINSTRGGLLVKDPTDEDGDNTLQILANIGSEDSYMFDYEAEGVMRTLRDIGFLRKEDIRDYGLLGRSCTPGSMGRFQFLTQWDPELMKGEKIAHNNDDDDVKDKRELHLSSYRNTLLHSEIKDCDEGDDTGINRFRMALEMGFEHFPNHLGFLFHRDENGDTAFELAVNEFGNENTIRTIQDAIPQHELLNYTSTYAPDYVAIFQKRSVNVYPRFLNFTTSLIVEGLRLGDFSDSREVSDDECSLCSMMIFETERNHESAVSDDVHEEDSSTVTPMPSLMNICDEIDDSYDYDDDIPPKLIDRRCCEPSWLPLS